jgi:hypothetical protein
LANAPQVTVAQPLGCRERVSTEPAMLTRHPLVPQTRPLRDAPSDRRRLQWCFVAAVLLHAVFAMHRASAREPVHVPPNFGSQPETELFSIEVATLLPGPAPGGGSENPDNEGPERASPERPTVPRARAPVAAPAPTRVELPTLAEQASEQADPEPAPPAEPDEVLALASDELSAEFADVRPALARRQLLDVHQPPTATAQEVAASRASTSRDYGYGPGAHGGPGGDGRGWNVGSGVVARPFALGGPTGAFRADICFLEAGTRTLSSVKHCPRVGTFFTSVLDVPPRQFNEGFPGISARTEWFAIRYTGRFTVRESGQYYFRLVSDDGSMLYVDGYTIIDNDGTHPPSSRLGNMRLLEGEHEFFLSYFQGPRDWIALQLFVTPPDGQERLFGPAI